jgi:hypothetical protein
MREVHVKTAAKKQVVNTATVALTHRRLLGVSRFAVSKAAIHVRERERYATMPKDAPSLSRHRHRAAEVAGSVRRADTRWHPRIRERAVEPRGSEVRGLLG